MRLRACAVVGAIMALGCGATHLGDDPTGEVSARGAELTLPKSDFLDAEWYLRQVFVDVPYGAARGFEGLASDLEKVRWEITEKHLVAYRAYEAMPGADPDAREPGWHEEPVAMYRIVEHVGDARASWFERQAMRVDWVDELDGVLWYGLPILQGTSWTVRAQDDADGPTFAYFDRGRAADAGGRGDGRYPQGALYYADFTNRVAITALQSSPLDCRPAQDPSDYSRPYDPRAYEVGVRTSLLRVPARSDYEPVAYDAFDYNKFGYFRRGRQSVDPYLGARLSGRVHVATRHNLWRDTWQLDPQGAPRRDAGGRLVPRPFAERTPQPVVFHLGEDFPPYLVDASFEAAARWDHALRRAVAAARQIDVADAPQMMIVCHNPVGAGDPEPCGPAGTRVRRGDLRFHHIVLVDRPQLCGPLGYGPSESDPETGEIFSAQAVIYEDALGGVAQFALDLIRFVNGDLDIAGLHDADDVRQAIRARLDPALPGRGAAAIALALPAAGEPGPGLLGAAAQRARPLAEREAALAASARRPGLREMLETSGVLDALPRASGGGLRDDVAAGLERARVPLVGAERGCALPADFQDAVVGVALEYLGRTDYDQMRVELAQRIYVDVLAHEIGHTLGLRHNFAASTDYVNYADEYWRLKTQGVLGVNDAGMLAEVPLTHPLRYVDDVFFLSQQTGAQAAAGMRRHALSSLMDYEARNLGGLGGLGKYDEAAIVYGYTTGRDRTVSAEAEGTDAFNTQQRGYVEVFAAPGDAAELVRYHGSASAPEHDALAESVHYHTFVSYLASSGADPLAGVPPNPPADGALAAQRVRERLRERRLVRQASVDAAGEVEVPYLFRDDSFVWAKASAYQFDAGADPLEVALDWIGRYRDYYPFEYFGRDRTGFDPAHVALRTADRYLAPLYDVFNRFYLSLSRPPTDSVLDLSRQLGALAAINLLAEVAGSTPSYGSYARDGDLYRLAAFEPDPGADLIVPPGLGRRWEAVVANTPNDITYVPYSYVEAGHDFVAYYALQVLLGAAPTWFLAPGGGYQTTFAGPFAIFERELTTLLNALVLQDSAVLGPRVSSDGAGGYMLDRPPLFAVDVGGGSFLDVETWRLTAPPLDDDLSLAPGPHLDVAQGRGQKLDAAVLGMALFVSLSSGGVGRQYQDQARVFRIGSGEELVAGEGFETVTYCDTLGTGVCYGALQPAGTTDPGLAARLVRRAAGLHPLAAAGDFAAQDELETLVQDMDLLRSLYETFESP